MIASGMNLVMTVIGFAVSTLFIVFVCTRLICVRIHLNASRRSFPMTSRSDLGLLERGFHGLEPVVVADFPTKKHSEELFSTSEDAQCTICLAEYYREDMLRILPSCGHSFHVTCIDIWLQQHSTCPVCRISLREFSGKKRSMQPLFSSATRSQFVVESLDNHSCNFSLSRQELSSRTLGADPVQESHCVMESDQAECGEHLSSLMEGNRVLKDTVEKCVESPSNP